MLYTFQELKQFKVVAEDSEHVGLERCIEDQVTRTRLPKWLFNLDEMKQAIPDYIPKDLPPIPEQFVLLGYGLYINMGLYKSYSGSLEPQTKFNDFSFVDLDWTTKGYAPISINDDKVIVWTKKEKLAQIKVIDHQSREDSVILVFDEDTSDVNIQNVTGIEIPKAECLKVATKHNLQRVLMQLMI